MAEVPSRTDAASLDGLTFYPSTSFDDPLRLATLNRYAILDTPPEEGFDDLVHLAAQACGVPVALVSLVDRDRQWFKARVGFPPCETDLDRSVCRFALAEPDLLVIPDLSVDLRTRENPLVTDDPHIRFYAGAPLRAPDGQVLGSLCVIDKVPRPEGLTESQADALRRFARQVMSQLELRRAMSARETLLREHEAAFVAREALRDTQAAVAAAGGDQDVIFDALVAGAMKAIPVAEGGVLELIDGSELVYKVVHGSLADQQGLRVPLNDSGAGQVALTNTPQLIGDVAAYPHVNRNLIERLKLRSAVFAPIARGSEVLGVLKLQSSQPDAFTPRDLEQARLFAGAAMAGLTEVAEAKAKRAIAANNVYWRGLFDRLTEGFVVGEVIRNALGGVTDWRYVEVNPAWGKLVGVDVTGVVGRTIREVFPGIEDAWVDEFAVVVDTGEPVTFTRQVDTIDRWYEGHAFRLENDRFGVIFLEVTARIDAENRRTALLRLGHRLRDATAVPEITRAAAEVAGRTLKASRAAFGRLDPDGEFIDVEFDWTAPGVCGIAGRHRFADYGDLGQDLLAGEPLIIEDVTADPRTAADPQPFLRLDVGALVNMPVRERGRTVAAFIVHAPAKRAWTVEALAFLRNVADRVEASVARLRAEEQQAVLNHELAHRLKNTLAVVQSIAGQTLRHVSEREPVEAFDRRIMALSSAHDVLLQKSWSAARLRTVMESVLALQATLDRFSFVGPDIEIGPQATLSLSLLLHELATNAAKYGALSRPEGRVTVRWRKEPGDVPSFVMDWIEGGGPPVTAPAGRGGFGSKLIGMGLVGTRVAKLSYDPHGFRAEFRAPFQDFQALQP